jgi:hypothetical protein
MANNDDDNQPQLYFALIRADEALMSTHLTTSRFRSHPTDDLFTFR